jgi:flagellin-like protein
LYEGAARPAVYSTRALSPVVGVVLMVFITLTLASAVAVGAFDAVQRTDVPQVRFEATADASTGQVALVHAGGDAVDVRALRVVVSIDGTPLARQPPVPFFSASGFMPGPTGPFNAAADSTWTAGERASVRLAGTNQPRLTAGSHVVVELYAEDVRIARVEVVA